MLKSIVCACLITLLSQPAVAATTFTFDNTPLKEAIQEIEEETGYFFLFRESRIAGIAITLSSDENSIFDELSNKLQRYQLALSVDHDRRQVLLTEGSETEINSRAITISGQIVDAATGERLPYATISWIENNSPAGSATNAAGRYTITRETSADELVLTASYIGYASREITLDVTEDRKFRDLTIRLTPKAVKSDEIIISGFTGFNPADTLLSGMIDAGRFSPLGESNSIRALQSHPAVAKSSALNDGLNVRGSTPDGFRVLLDGMSIFNQSHIYGLLDSFNADAVQSSGFYYGVTPANIDSPTGGSLNLITRTGSRNGYRARAGISNTSVNGTLEGPLGNRSSWLISGRTSYLDLANWFNNSSLIQWGLNIDRPRRVAGTQPDFTDLVLRPGESSARFVDLHTKLYLETAASGRLTFSGYLGGNDISQTSQRRTRQLGTGGDFGFETVTTSDTWGNALVSLTYENELSNRLFSTTLAGMSAYETDFQKDDFVYSQINSTAQNEGVTVFTYPFQNRSIINEMRLKQELEWNKKGVSLTGGALWKFYRGEYREASFDRPAFSTQTDAHLIDSYLHADWRPFRDLQLSAGSRFYYYSPDQNTRYAPRVRVAYTLFDWLTLSTGYSVNYQFLHKVSIQNSTSADVWILSTNEQSPASSRQVTAGIEFAPSTLFYLRVEGYQKSYENMRFHELNTQTLSNTFSGTPWFFRNEGDARGLEFILRNKLAPFTLTQTYTLSDVSYRNPFLGDGESINPEWDRPHSYNAVLETRLSNNLILYLSWLSMSGAPNDLAGIGGEQRQTTTRLDPYHRMDATLSFHHTFSNRSKLDVSISVFNLLDRDNVWYRTYDFNFDETRTIPRLSPVAVDVLDLGFQPSFNVQYSF